MKKFWIIYAAEKNIAHFKCHDTLASAQDVARQMAVAGDDEYVVLEAISVAKKPSPPVETITL